MNQDFVKFCSQYGVISDKSSGEKVTLKLNEAQRYVLDYLEQCRMSKAPCRLLILKSRQLGISTLLQYYFTWLLMFHCEMETFLSLCHNKQLSKSFVSNMISIYTRVNHDLKPQKVDDSILCDKRGNNLIYASAKNYNSIRGYNVGIAHLSESAFWHSKSSDWSEEVIRSVMGSVGTRPGSFVVLESTSDGRNNYFYRLWCDSMSGMTSYHPIFLSWNLCEYYSKSLNDDDLEEMKTLTPREEKLLSEGYTMEQLNWYRHKRREFQDDASFLREFPCTADESFTMSSNLVFSNEEIEQCETMISSSKLVDFTKSHDGKIVCHHGFSYNQWFDLSDKQHLMRFFVVVTIGACYDESKANVITCWSMSSDTLNLCLERRYISDIDTLIDDSIMVARYYCNAMLIVEVNSMNRLGMSSKEYYMRKLKKRYTRLFIQDGNIGYSLSHKRKLRGLFSFRRRLREKKINDHSNLLVEEMKNFVMEDEELTASYESHDDVLLCRLILCDVLDEIGPLNQVLNPKDFYTT